MERYQILLDKNTILAEECEELTQLRTEADQQMLRKVHAAALLQWRGHQIPPAEKL